jgi:adenine phosphoribosyltransferase
MSSPTLEADLLRVCPVVPDFPVPGILFRDITGLLINPPVFQATIKHLCNLYRSSGVEGVAGMEARGFLVAAAMAIELGVPCVLLRKPSKLPSETFEVEYGKEYGKDKLCVQKNNLSKGQRILIVDDVLATGGTANAAAELITLAGAVPIGFAFFFEIDGLGGRDKLQYPTVALAKC